MSDFDILNTIHSPSDIQSLPIASLEKLCTEIRQRIIEVLSVNGGHLSSNLGTVELTVALHYVFNSPYDKFIFDTSHQSYPHKLLTGRNPRFNEIRKYKGLCGFSHPKESIHDHFYAGHAGTAFSLGLGMAKNRELLKTDEHIIPILGDASLTCGLTLEALNNIPGDLKNFIVVLNDNKMSISENVGNIKNILSRILSHPISNKFYEEINSILSKFPGLGKQLAKQGQKITESIKNLVSPAAFFEQFGLSYVGPIDGHDVKKLVDKFNSVKHYNRPILMHVMTVKGKGMPIASENPTTYHGVKPFDKSSGKFLTTSSSSTTFPKIFGKEILKMAQKDPSIVVVNPATPAGSCLTEMRKQLPERCLDVGIAEGHAVTFAGGLAKGKKLKVICNIYATFLQRALDNIFHDVCLQELPVVFTIDRASISGPDGCTHHGIYDISFLSAMPNMVIAQPRSGMLLKELMHSSFTYDRPVAIRYPNLVTHVEEDAPVRHRDLAQADVLSQGENLVIIGLGHMSYKALEIKKILSSYGVNPTIIDPVFIKPIDADLFLDVFSTHPKVVTIEEHSVNGGLGSAINKFIINNNMTNQILNIGIPDTFVQHGKNEDLYKEIGLDVESITERILKFFDLKKKSYDYSPVS
ncbi:MAG: 1-deoxy-D-xylulose-5-phosphate synthase [Chlamydiae bacterium CG10_big_fil_rev_8_21_14_0_10_35_9]|nr:MAG: 1-deoxy-D-xylulose-5-phosphate synthase [Chlamydiae bacterium CG10_big_fil_rev_8_21_14_0_10_35_9]